MSLMSRGKSFLNRKMGDAAGVSVSYTRAAETISLTAVIGRTVFASNLEGKARIEFGEIDLIIVAADLEFDGVQVKPERGDRIGITLDGTALTLELMIPQTGEPAWRYSDPERTRIRLHCKRVG